MPIVRVNDGMGCAHPRAVRARRPIVNNRIASQVDQRRLRRGRRRLGPASLDCRGYWNIGVCLRPMEWK